MQLSLLLVLLSMFVRCFELHGWFSWLTTVFTFVARWEFLFFSHINIIKVTFGFRVANQQLGFFGIWFEMPSQSIIVELELAAQSLTVSLFWNLCLYVNTNQMNSANELIKTQSTRHKYDKLITMMLELVLVRRMVLLAVAADMESDSKRRCNASISF